MKLEHTKECFAELKKLGYTQKSINVMLALKLKDTDEINNVPVKELKKVRNCGKVTIENLQNPKPDKIDEKKEQDNQQSKRWKEECQRREKEKKRIGDTLKTYDAEKLILYIKCVEDENFDSVCFKDLKNHKNKISNAPKTREIKVLLGYLHFLDHLTKNSIPFERYVAVESRGDIGFYRSIHVTLDNVDLRVMFHVTTDDDFGRVAIRTVVNGKHWICKNPDVREILKDYLDLM